MGNLRNNYSITARAGEDFYWIIGSGYVNGQAIYDILQILNQHKQTESRRFIVDLTKAELVANVLEIEQHIASALQSGLNNGCLFAFLHGSTDVLQVSRYRFLESFFGLAAIGLKVFTDKGEALSWLRAD